MSSSSETSTDTKAASEQAKAERAPASEQPTGGGWREIWSHFAHIDPRSLGLFRIAFGILMLCDLYRRFADATFFYSNQGFLPNHVVIYKPMSRFLFSIYHAASTPEQTAWMFAATAVIFFVYTIGYRTKLFQLLAAVCITSLHSRNILLENGGDVVVNLLAIWTLFMPLGNRFSVDAMLASWKERTEHHSDDLNDRRFPTADRKAQTSLAYVFAIANLTAIYYFNVVHKNGWVWKKHVAVHYVLWSDRLVQPLGVLIRDKLPLALQKSMGFGTLVIESSLVVLLLSQLLYFVTVRVFGGSPGAEGKGWLLSPHILRACRRVAAFEIIALHAGFQTVGHFGLFSFSMMCHAILLLSSEDWDRLAARMSKKLVKRDVFYDASCGICHQLCRLLKRFDHNQRLTFIANWEGDRLPDGIDFDTVQETIVVATKDGKRAWIEAEAVGQILRALPFGWALARLMALPGFSALAKIGYQAIAKRRRDISSALGYGACGRPLEITGAEEEPFWRKPKFFPKTRFFVSRLVLVGFAFAAVTQILAENRAVPKSMKPKRQSELGARIAQYPRMYQGWSMFAPIPPMDDGRLVVDGLTIDGRHIDPLTGKAPDYTLPGVGQGMLMSQLWYEFHDRVRRPNNSRYLSDFAGWAKRWHKQVTHRPKDKLMSYKMYWVSRPTQPPGQVRRLPTRKTEVHRWTRFNPRRSFGRRKGGHRAMPPRPNFAPFGGPRISKPKGP